MCKKVYLSCKKENLDFYINMASNIYKDAAFIVNNIENAELVIAIPPLVENDISTAVDLRKNVVFVDEKLIPVKLYKKMLL